MKFNQLIIVILRVENQIKLLQQQCDICRNMNCFCFVLQPACKQTISKEESQQQYGKSIPNN